MAIYYTPKTLSIDIILKHINNFYETCEDKEEFLNDLIKFLYDEILKDFKKL